MAEGNNTELQPIQFRSDVDFHGDSKIYGDATVYGKARLYDVGGIDIHGKDSDSYFMRITFDPNSGFLSFSVKTGG